RHGCCKGPKGCSSRECRPQHCC
uniref:Mu-conotoxin TIIIA n=2 Tax=Conus TaxID=6490 RepID=CM3A_CONTU|nr:RecName: Full=Mu-conotoxin SIIIC; AltName: Full=Mu-conotoxin TIIIA-like [Conus striatus]P0C350.1 RecName: Full=Mu-conotoxin TIIIA [Conus tulipa]